jgi:nitrilase
MSVTDDSFPKGNAINNWTEEYLPMYIENSITVGDSTWQILLDGAKSAGIYAGIMFSERDGDHIYMAQALLSPKGAIIHHRRKLRPSGSERWFFSDGTMEGLQVQATDIGRVGMLECGE